MSKAPAIPDGAERAPYKVRGGFTVHLRNKAYRGGQIVDLTAAEAEARRHQVEAAPDQAEGGPDSTGETPKNGARRGA
ncbi:hypothetical protein FE249_00780 [Acidiphilium multivorum]|uniref:hypothetical protein n=1 Tax=Acidiphilium multivorum TaxID=62140 RepID=UPI001F4C3B99|nr:hypothetical protein [Acidiphilium multivorum]UNC12863.1 hypothetical protein FE249_00780 [Acidiphilium multivorum]